MPLIATRGAASAQGFGEFAQTAVATYIEDVFSTYLYTGNDATQTITNGIDLSGEGGLVWFKGRSGSGGTWNNALFDTARGTSVALASNLTNGNLGWTDSLSSFNSTGFTLGQDSAGVSNLLANNYASWTFRKAKKFFDVVTYTGDGVAGRAVSHNLGAVPGCIIVKRLNSAENWFVYHRSLGAGSRLSLNTTDAATAEAGPPYQTWYDTPTSTQFYVGSTNRNNGSGSTYVAYLFAHDAGGFGDDGEQNIISCGSFVATTTSTPTTVNLGWEPQFLMTKVATTAGNWLIMDNMRGMPVGGLEAVLRPNLSDAEATPLNLVDLTPTGFNQPSGGFVAGETYIYIAIRRGPMKTPESGTSVFYPYVTASASNVGSTSGTMYNSQIVTDHAWQKAKGGTDGWYLGARLTGTAYMKSETTAAESTSAAIVWDSNRGAWAFSDPNYGLYCFKRAPGFFDVVCYTGTGSATTFNHNLGVAPELIIAKKRSAAGDSWAVYVASLTSSYYMLLNSTQAATLNTSRWTANPPTSTIFRVGTDGDTNDSGATYVAYLFATVAGVSKVGSYTGTGTTLQVNCGFTAGARFVMIKRSDSTGDWYVWDSARGIVAGNDPYLLLNSSAAEVTNTDYVDTYSAGFEISSTAPAAINANGGTFIFLAIA